MLMDAALHLPVSYSSSSLFSSLIDGVNWLKKAAEICVPFNRRKFKLSDAEEVLGQSQVFLVLSSFFYWHHCRIQYNWHLSFILKPLLH